MPRFTVMMVLVLLTLRNGISEGQNQATDLSYARAAKSAMPAVVNLKIFRRPEFNQPLFALLEDFFGGTSDESCVGSGVIVTQDGYILTNWHLTEGASSIHVILNEQEWEGILVGEDPQTDLAVVKVAAKNLPYFNFGDSSKLEVGDVVLAIGNPYGLGQAVSMGIVSATERGENGMPDYIQTDAAIHPGSSGGALINMRGELIGISTAFLLSAVGGNSGIGFALPATSAKEIFHQIVQSGFVVRGWLGIELQDMNRSLARSFAFRGSSGALVNEVIAGGPGERAGILRGDIIAEFNRETVRNAHQLCIQIAKTSPGNAVQIKVFRKGTLHFLNATIEKSPAVHINKSEADGQGEIPFEGVDLETITSDLASSLNLRASIQGAIVTFVNPASVAARSGLRIGDVIQEVNGIQVLGVEDVGKVLAELQDQNPVLLLIYRGRRLQYIALE